jgi:hypothetical protein
MHTKQRRLNSPTWKLGQPRCIRTKEMWTIEQLCTSNLFYWKTAHPRMKIPSHNDLYIFMFIYLVADLARFLGDYENTKFIDEEETSSSLQ